MAAPVATGPSELHGKEYTAFTRVEERSWIDVRQIINDLDTRKADLTILQAVLNGKEKQIEELNKKCQSMTDKPAETGKELVEEQQRLLQRLFPSVSFETTSTQKDRVASIEKQATQYLQQLSNTKPSGSSPDVDAQLAKELQAQSKLQSEVAHYKVVLADTEAILQQLQNSVEQEEKKWSGKVSQSDRRDVGETTRDGSTSREVEVVETPANVDPLNAATPTQLSPRVEPRDTRPRRATRMPKKYEDFVT